MKKKNYPFLLQFLTSIVESNYISVSMTWSELINKFAKQDYIHKSRLKNNNIILLISLHIQNNLFCC